MTNNSEKNIPVMNGIRKNLPFTLKLLAAVISAAFLIFAFPPFKHHECAWIGITLLIIAAKYSRPRQAFLLGLFSGMIFWMCTLSWLLVLIKTGGYTIMVLIGWITLSCYSAIYTGIFTMILSWLFTKWFTPPEDKSKDPDFNEALRRVWEQNILMYELKNISLMFLSPVIWIGLEYVRSNLFTGFPWNQLGISQYGNVYMIQMASWGGVYAVSAIIVLVNASLAITVLRYIEINKKRRIAPINLGLVLAMVIMMMFYFNGISAYSDYSKPRSTDIQLRATAIQSGIPQSQKWSEDFVIQIYEKLSNLVYTAQFTKPDIVIFPETSLPPPVNVSYPETVSYALQSINITCPTLIGVIEYDFADGTTNYYNSSMLIDSTGKITEIYRKRHLVPFGEYIPFDNIFRSLQNLCPIGLSCTSGRNSVIFKLSNPRVDFSTSICFEDTFAYLAREDVKKGSKLIINQTNDGWFDNSAASFQHMVHCVFRCVENRVPAIRVANTGVTCLIDRNGNIDRRIQEASIIRAFIKPGYNTPPLDFSLNVPMGFTDYTFYTKYGDLPFAIPCALITFILFVLVLKDEAVKNRRIPA